MNDGRKENTFRSTVSVSNLVLYRQTVILFSNHSLTSNYAYLIKTVVIVLLLLAEASFFENQPIAFQMLMAFATVAHDILHINEHQPQRFTVQLAPFAVRRQIY